HGVVVIAVGAVACVVERAGPDNALVDDDELVVHKGVAPVFDDGDAVTPQPVGGGSVRAAVVGDHAHRNATALERDQRLDDRQGVQVKGGDVHTGLRLEQIGGDNLVDAADTLLFRRAARVGEKDLEPLVRSEEHTSELQSRENLVCRLLLEKKKI